MSTDQPAPGHLRFRRLSTENRYGLVIVFIVVTYCVTAGAGGPIGSAVVVIFQLLTVWLALTVSESHRLRRFAGLAIFVVVAVTVAGATLGWATEGSQAVAGALYSLNAILYLLAPILILMHLVRREKVDLQTFLGAIAAYLLIGMMFAFSYRALGELQTAPFFGSAGDGSASDDLFFSFVTLTTTGYGDLVPADNPGQSLAVLEAITGQLFLVTALAKIVTAWNPMRGRRGEPDAG